MQLRGAYFILACLLWNFSGGASLSEVQNAQGVANLSTLVLDFSPGVLTMVEGQQANVTLNFHDNGTVNFSEQPWMKYTGHLSVMSDTPSNMIVVNGTNVLDVTPCDFLMGRNFTVILNAKNLGYANLFVYWEPQGQPGIFEMTICSELSTNRTAWIPNRVGSNAQAVGGPPKEEPDKVPEKEPDNVPGEEPEVVLQETTNEEPEDVTEKETEEPNYDEEVDKEEEQATVIGNTELEVPINGNNTDEEEGSTTIAAVMKITTADSIETTTMKKKRKHRKKPTHLKNQTQSIDQQRQGRADQAGTQSDVRNISDETRSSTPAAVTVKTTAEESTTADSVEITTTKKKLKQRKKPIHPKNQTQPIDHQREGANQAGTLSNNQNSFDKAGRSTTAASMETMTQEETMTADSVETTTTKKKITHEKKPTLPKNQTQPIDQQRERIAEQVGSQSDIQNIVDDARSFMTTGAIETAPSEKSTTAVAMKTTTMKKDKQQNMTNPKLLTNQTHSNSDSSIFLLLEEHVAEPEQTTVGSTVIAKRPEIPTTHQAVKRKPLQPNINRGSDIYDQGVTFLFKRLHKLTMEQTEPVDAKVLLLDGFQVKILRDAGMLDTVFVIMVTLLVMFNTLMMGFEIELSAIRSILKKPIGPAVGLFCQFVFMPIASYVLGLLLLNDPIQRLGLFVLGCSNGGKVSNFWTLLLKGDINLSMAMTLISTICALFMMPMWLYTLGQTILEDASIGIPFTNLIFSLFSFTTPVVIGMSIRRCKPHWADLVNKCILPFSLLLIIALLILSIWNLQYIFSLMTWQMLVAGLCVAWGGCIFGAFMAWMLCQNRAQIVAISLETVIQSPRITFMVLRLTLPQPDSDISVVAPMAQVLMTTFPLLLTFLAITVYMNFYRQHCCKEQQKQDVAKDDVDTENPLLVKGVISGSSGESKDPELYTHNDNGKPEKLEESMLSKMPVEVVSLKNSDHNQNMNGNFKNGFVPVRESSV